MTRKADEASFALFFALSSASAAPGHEGIVQDHSERRRREPARGPGGQSEDDAAVVPHLHCERTVAAMSADLGHDEGLIAPAFEAQA
jgi:hypothetical protein